MKDIHKRYLIVGAVSLIAGLTLYRRAIFEVVAAVLNREGSSHGVFIPFLTAYFIWTRKADLAGASAKKNPWGLVFCAFGLLPLLVPSAGYHVKFIGYIFFLSGIVLSGLGGAYFKVAAFPLFFLITMVPINGRAYYEFADLMRGITFEGALAVISIFDITAFRSGWYLHLPDTTLEVAKSCSGIRYLVSYVVFGMAYAYLMKRTLAGRLATVAATIPISLGASILRLSFIFLGAYYISPQMAEYWPHVIISWSVFFAVLMGSIYLDQYFMKRWETGNPEGRENRKFERTKGVVRLDQPDEMALTEAQSSQRKDCILLGQKRTEKDRKKIL